VHIERVLDLVYVHVRQVRGWRARERDHADFER
jgi:hypothetical protein